MPSALDYVSTSLVKTIYLGDSGTGKTGSLVSLLPLGYRIRMIDLDAGIGTLIQFTKHQHPDLLAQIDYVAPRDKYKTDPTGITLDGPPRAFIDTMKFLDKWEDESNPADWGAESILVVDSLSGLGRAAYNWFDKLNPGVKDKRQIFKLAQDAIEDFLQNITAESFRTNVIIISHVRYDEHRTKGYTNAIGSALGPVIPRYFNNLILAETVGQGDKARRVIRTRPTGVVDLKNERSFEVESEMPLESGMATLFETLKGK